MEAGELCIAKATSANFQNTIFMALELSRATWLVAVFAPKLGDKISVHAVPGGDVGRLLELVGKVREKLTTKGAQQIGTVSSTRPDTTVSGSTAF